MDLSTTQYDDGSLYLYIHTIQMFPYGTKHKKQTVVRGCDII